MKQDELMNVLDLEQLGSATNVATLLVVDGVFMLF